jgi:hypothetical protein
MCSTYRRQFQHFIGPQEWIVTWGLSSQLSWQDVLCNIIMQSAEIVAMKEYLVIKQMGVSLTAQLLHTWSSFMCNNWYQDGDL